VLAFLAISPTRHVVGDEARKRPVPRRTPPSRLGNHRRRRRHACRASRPSHRAAGARGS